MDKQLRQALVPFAAAYRRLRFYDEETPTDDAALFAEQQNCYWELLKSEEGPQVTVADLRRASEVLGE